MKDKATKRAEAEARQARWDAMTEEERKATKTARGFTYAPEMGIK